MNSKQAQAYFTNIISQTQKGFLRGRYIGECDRIISDLMDKLKEEDIPGLLMIVDFEKAFDTVEWPFIEQTPGISKQIYDKYKLSKILWNCGCSPKEMEKPYFRAWEAACY